MVCIDNKSNDSEKLEIEDRDRSGSCNVNSKLIICLFIVS